MIRQSKDHISEPSSFKESLPPDEVGEVVASTCESRQLSLNCLRAVPSDMEKILMPENFEREERYLGPCPPEYPIYLPCLGNQRTQIRGEEI